MFLSNFNFFLDISFWFFQSFSGLQTHVCIFTLYLFLHLFVPILAFLLFISDPFSSLFFLYMYLPVSHYYHGMSITQFVFFFFVPIFIFTILSPSPFLPSHIYFHIFIFHICHIFMFDLIILIFASMYYQPEPNIYIFYSLAFIPNHLHIYTFTFI